MNKKKVLSTILLLMTAFGFVMLSIPLIASLKPTVATILSRQSIIDISQIKPGGVIRVENSYYGEIWITRRSDKEIHTLPRNFFVPLWNKEMGQELPAMINKETRSIFSDVFVFNVWNLYRGNILLEEMPNNRILCNQFKRLTGMVKANDDQTLNGLFACTIQYGYQREIENNPFVYDLAGRSVEPWISPLRIPNYRYKNKNTIVVGPEI